MVMDMPLCILVWLLHRFTIIPVHTAEFYELTIYPRSSLESDVEYS